jgi:hypothetical protein
MFKRTSFSGVGVGLDRGRTVKTIFRPVSIRLSVGLGGLFTVGIVVPLFRVVVL